MRGTVAVMMLHILEVLWYSAVFLAAGAWLLAQLVPNDTHPTVGRVLGIALVCGAVTVGYLMAFEKSADIDCRPAGPAIFNDC